MGRTPCCDKTKVRRGPWSPQEDTILNNFVQTHGSGGNWIALPQKAGLKRCGKSCRLRWLNYLRPDIKHGGFTHEEDNFILTLYLNIGSRWSVIASHLQGRTDNDVKNYWNTKLKKKLAQHMHSRSATTTTNIWNVPGGNSMLLPKAESNYDYETMEHRSNVMNSASTTSFPYPMDMNYDQQKLSGRPKIVPEISNTKDPMSNINFNEEEEVIEIGTSYTPLYFSSEEFWDLDFF